MFHTDSLVTLLNPTLSSVKSQSNIIWDRRYIRGRGQPSQPPPGVGGGLGSTSTAGLTPFQAWEPNFPPRWCFQRHELGIKIMTGQLRKMWRPRSTSSDVTQHKSRKGVAPERCLLELQPQKLALQVWLPKTLPMIISWILTEINTAYKGKHAIFQRNHGSSYNDSCWGTKPFITLETCATLIQVLHRAPKMGLKHNLTRNKVNSSTGCGHAGPGTN